MPAQPSAYRRRASSRALWRGRVSSVARALLAAAALTVLLAGLPWGLVHFVGWPLPRSVPSRDDVETLLTTPMSTTFLIDTLACILWPVWALFVVDVARAATSEVRGLQTPTLPAARPLQSMAAALVGTLMLSLLVLRPAASATAAPAPSRAAATAPAKPGSTATTEAGRHIPVGRVEVRAPRDGVYDSLWRIADRTLGDGSRWPEIYALNHGQPQADGRTLTNPSLIRPGWVLRIPASTAPTARPPHPPAPAVPAKPVPAPTTPRPSTPTPATAPAIPSPTRQHTTTTAPTAERRHDHGAPGLSLPTGAFVSAALATAVAGALALVRLRRRIRYQPGSGERDDLTIAPVVRALRIAHDQTAEGPDVGQPALEAVTSAEAPDALAATHPVGVRDGHLVAWDIARTRGLGLIGEGAPDAARALLVALLADQSAEVIAPRPDTELLLDSPFTGWDEAPGLRVVDDLDAALDVLESELLSRARTRNDEGGIVRELVLVAAPRPASDRRLQAVLDNGSSLHMAGVLLGQWRPGGTLRVRADGTVVAASPGLAEALAGTRLFNLPAADAQALLDLLGHAAPPPPPGAPAVPTPPGPRSPHGPAPEALRPLPPEPRHDRPKLSTGSAIGNQLRQGRTAPGGEAEPTADGETERAVEEPEPEPGPPQTLPLELTFLGRVRLTHHLPDGNTHADLTSCLTPKHREVLTYLALHPDGARREALAAAIWPDAPRTRPYNSFHATLSQLRRALRTATHDEQTDVTLNTGGVYALDPHRTTIDLWAFHDALHAARADESGRPAAVERAIALYTGDLATDVAAEWIEAPREALRRDILDALSVLIRDVRAAHPAEALRLLERARGLDPYNEAVYCAIARLQAQLGHGDAIPRTLHLLTTVLGEIDEHPSPETIALFTDLMHPAEAAG